MVRPSAAQEPGLRCGGLSSRVSTACLGPLKRKVSVLNAMGLRCAGAHLGCAPWHPCKRGPAV